MREFPARTQRRPADHLIARARMGFMHGVHDSADIKRRRSMPRRARLRTASSSDFGNAPVEAVRVDRQVEEDSDERFEAQFDAGWESSWRVDVPDS